MVHGESMERFRILQLVFWGLLAAILVAALVPWDVAPTLFASDKLNHMLAFFVLAAFTRLLWPRAHAFVAVALLAFYGGLIELLQWWLDLGRTADWADFGADLVAIIAGLIAGSATVAVRRRMAASGSAPSER